MSIDSRRSTGEQRHGPDTAAFHVSGAVVAYDRTPVLHGATFDVPTGETLAILGPNGSGKTTLMRAMLGLTPLTDGTINIHGVPLERFRDWGRIGYVPQRLSAGGGVPATVREIVASGQVAHRRRLRRGSRADRAAVDEALAAAGLSERAGDSVHELSGGQQQRVLIARTLAGRPDTFVMDEPMAGVDAESQHALASTVSRLNEQGATVVLVLHELGPLHPLIQRSITLSGGVITQDGPPPASGDECLVPRSAAVPDGNSELPAEHDHVHPHADEPPTSAALPNIEVPPHD